MEGLGCSGNVSNRPQFVGLLTCELTTKPVATQPGSYLLHPFGIATQVAKSSIVFTNFLVALAVASALAGQYSRTFPTAPHATNPSPRPHPLRIQVRHSRQRSPSLSRPISRSIRFSCFHP